MLKERGDLLRDGEWARYARDPVPLALAVLSDRISRLSAEDRDDLFELLVPLLKGDTEDDRTSAAQAMFEILENGPSGIRSVELGEPDQSDEALSKWLSYISRRIKDARKEAGLTQAQLAELSGLPQSHISRLERGRHSPSSLTLEKIAAALKLPVEHFDPSA